MKVIIQLQYSLTDSRVFHDVKNITQKYPPNPTYQKLKKNLTQPNPWMDPTHDQLWVIPCTKFEHFGIIRFWVIVRKKTRIQTDAADRYR